VLRIILQVLMTQHCIHWLQKLSTNSSCYKSNGLHIDLPFANRMLFLLTALHDNTIPDIQLPTYVCELRTYASRGGENRRS